MTSCPIQPDDRAPADPIEWMPFLQAYARVRDVDRPTELEPAVTADPYIAAQACQTLKTLQPLDSVIEVIDSWIALKSSRILTF